jgi:hypothetical protein
MIITIAWIILLVALAGWAAHAAHHPRRWAGLAEMVSAASGSRWGRLALFVCWAFIGLHLFTRYTLPIN